MITMTIGKSGFICQGHADYAEKGKDIVCAATSALTQAALLGLNRYGEVTVEQDEGFIKVGLYKPNSYTTAVLTTLYLGMKMVAKEYKEYVKIRGKM